MNDKNMVQIDSAELDLVVKLVVSFGAQLAAANKRAEEAEASRASMTRVAVQNELDARTLAEECRVSRKKLISSAGGFMVGGSLEDTLNLHDARAATDADGALARHTKETNDANPHE